MLRLDLRRQYSTHQGPPALVIPRVRAQAQSQQSPGFTCSRYVPSEEPRIIVSASQISVSKRPEQRQAPFAALCLKPALRNTNPHFPGTHGFQHICQG
ncbi:hypothetical protein NDU88_001933 [Pleurodeles waltl]|uniref:Uncharacterized protein n=1 Tax=Pleurodeles waltl TaxID=8319 RepID=A0AAV7NC98_PLEWA|nr:hypothetical protein NDU88_001933 [Pleurodeles waltl]